MSDIYREIPDIELILYILEQEQQQKLPGMYQVSHELKELITFLRSLRAILIKEKNGEELTEQEQKILRKQIQRRLQRKLYASTCSLPMHYAGNTVSNI